MKQIFFIFLTFFLNFNIFSDELQNKNQELNINFFDVNKKLDGIFLGKNIQFIEDKSFSFEEAKTKFYQGKYQKIEKDFVNLGVNPDGFWFAIPLKNSSTKKKSFILSFDNPFIENYKIYCNGPKKKIISGGTEVSSLKREFWSFGQDFLINVKANQERIIFVNLKSNFSSLIVFKLLDLKEFQRHQEILNIIIGIIMGWALGISVYYLGMFFVLRDFSLFIYVNYIIFGILLIAIQNNLAFKYLGFDVLNIGNEESFLFVFFIWIFLYTTFVKSFLKIKKNRKYYKFLTCLQILNVIFLFNTIFFDIEIAVIYLTILEFSIIIFPLIAYQSLKRGFKPAKYYLISTILFSSTIFIAGFVNAGFLNLTIIEVNLTTTVTLLFEIIFFSFAIADKYRDVENRLKTVLQNQKEELRREVEFKTLELIKEKEEAEKIARTDTLTEIYNRRAFFELGETFFRKSKNLNKELSIAILDIDFFKKVNDTYGHQVGDEVIKYLANNLQKIQDEDSENRLIARFGGEEFVIMFYQKSLKESKVILEKLRIKIEESSLEFDENVIVKFTVSIGISKKTEKDKTIDCILRRADDNLYVAKNNGRNQVVI